MKAASSKERKYHTTVILLLLCSFVVPACAIPAPNDSSMMVTQGVSTNITNLSFTRQGEITEFTVTPTPIDLFRAELDEETLPGPRYMAFGPSVIGISIDPRLLAVCFAIALIALVIWFVSIRNRDDKKEN